MPARVLRNPLVFGFGLTLLGSVILLLLLTPTTGRAQGPVDSSGQGRWIPLDGGEAPSDRAYVVPSQAMDGTTHEQSVGMVPPMAEDDGNQVFEASQRDSNQSVDKDLHGALAPNGSAAYSSPLVIPAADLRNNGATTAGYLFRFNNSGDGGYVRSNFGPVCMQAPAYLPNNATVTQMWVTLYDNGGLIRPVAGLYRVDNFAVTVPPTVIMAAFSSPGQSANIQNVSGPNILSPVVVYPEYSYYVGACMYDLNQRIYSVRLYYTVP